MKLDTIAVTTLILLVTIFTGCAITGTGASTTISSPSIMSQVQAAQAVACSQIPAPPPATGTVAYNPLACACFPAVQTFLTQVSNPVPTPAPTATSGTASAGNPLVDLVVANAVVNNVQGGIPQYLLVACGPLYSQIHGQLLTGAAFLAAIGIK